MNIIDLLTLEEKKKIQINNFDSNQVIFCEGDICDRICIIIDGEVLVNTYTEFEKTETINLFKKDDLIGQYLIFLDKPFYLGTAVTKKKTKAAFIKKDYLLTLLQENNKFMQEYLKIICRNSFQIKQQAKMLAHKNIRDRILFYLKTASIDNKITINSITELASTLSLPRPSVSRELLKMENDKLIKRDKKVIYII